MGLAVSKMEILGPDYGSCAPAWPWHWTGGTWTKFDDVYDQRILQSYNAAPAARGVKYLLVAAVLILMGLGGLPSFLGILCLLVGSIPAIAGLGFLMRGGQLSSRLGDLESRTERERSRIKAEGDSTLDRLEAERKEAEKNRAVIGQMIGDLRSRGPSLTLGAAT